MGHVECSAKMRGGSGARGANRVWGSARTVKRRLDRHQAVYWPDPLSMAVWCNHSTVNGSHLWRVSDRSLSTGNKVNPKEYDRVSDRYLETLCLAKTIHGDNIRWRVPNEVTMYFGPGRTRYQWEEFWKTEIGPWLLRAIAHKRQ